MDYLPNETLMHVLGVVPDKIYVSMVCKKWTKLLDSMYKQNLISNFNDSYYLKKQYDKTTIFKFENIIHNITNYKCLNYICHVIKEGYNTNNIYNLSLLRKLFLRNCDLKNISNPHDIKFLVSVLRRVIEDICTYIFNMEYYDILQFITPFFDVTTYWVDRIANIKDVNILIKKIDMFIEKRIDSYNNIRRAICKYNNFKYRNNILEYLDEKIYN